MNKMITAVSLVLMVSASSQLVMAHGGATGIVKERMDLMDNMKDAVKQLKAIYKGDVEYDPDTIRNAALVIRDHSGDAMSRLFPEGSLEGKSEAKPIIWQEWNRFRTLADDQEKIAQGLYNAAQNRGTTAGGNMMAQSMMGSGSMMGNSKHIQQNMTNPEHLGSMPSDMVFKMLTDTCSSCHTRYRNEKDK